MTRIKQKLLLILALAVGLVGVERLLQRFDLPLTPVWPAYFMLLAGFSRDDNRSEMVP